MEPEKDIFDQWSEEKITWYRKIYLWWHNDGKYMRINFLRGIKNLRYWFPIIWKDRDWDSYFIFEILKHKLTAQAKYIGGRNYHTRASKDARDMRLCVKLMQLFQDETYCMEDMDYSKTKHWFEDALDHPGFKTWESRILEENFDDYFKKYPLVYKQVMNGAGAFSIVGREDDKQVIAMSIAHTNHDRCRKLLFKIMEERIGGWWD